MPSIGDKLQTQSASGIVDYIYNVGAAVVIYLKDANGVFSTSDSLFRDDGDFIGEYTKQGPIGSPSSSNTELGGYWVINTPSYTPTTVTENTDQAT